MKYRKKPVVIEAFQTDVGDNLPQWFHDAVANETIVPAPGSEGMIIKTLEGDHLARPGDYIIKGVADELYPCKPDIFEATYEPAE